jgi:hypothetical protein
VSTQNFRYNWLTYKGATTGWDGSLVTGDDTDIPIPIALTSANSGSGTASAIGTAQGQGYNLHYGSGTASATGTAQGQGYALSYGSGSATATGTATGEGDNGESVATKVGGDSAFGGRKHRGFDLEQWKREHASDKAIEETIRKTWARIKGEPEVADEVAEVVREFVQPQKTKAKPQPVERRIDWAALVRDADALSNVIELDRKARRVREEDEDDDEVLMFLAA